MTAGKLAGAATMLNAGLVGHANQLAAARASISGLDAGQPQRAFDLEVMGGISARLLPDRGLDIGSAWFDGLPLGWLSRVGEVRAAAPGTGSWIGQFGGGLLTTCGLQNVGLAAESHGQHGAFSATPAREVRVERVTTADQELELVVSATVTESDALDVHLRCERRITTRTGVGLLTLTDTVTNLGAREVAAPMLYHVNLGAPLWTPGARVHIPGRVRTIPRDTDAQQGVDEWDQAPTPSAVGVERVFEHLLDPGMTGRASVEVVHPDIGLAAMITWDLATMPRLHQWVHPRAGVYVLGIEPANCSVLGRAADRAAGQLPMLDVGEARTTSLQIAVSRDV